MLRNSLTRNPVIISSLCALILLLSWTAAHYYWLDTLGTNIFWIGIGAIALIYLAFITSLILKRRKTKQDQHIETEEESLAMVIDPLLSASRKKPLYLLLGNKGSGKAQFLNHSNAIKPVDKTRTIKNDFFEWYESDDAAYLKPNPRLVFQEVSASDAGLWNRLIKEVIAFRPRKPFSGCLLFIDFEFIIVNEEDQYDYVLSSLTERIHSIGKETSMSLPLYLFMNKLDKLDGFKEYIQYSTLKSTLEFLSIPLKEAKGALVDYYTDSHNNLVRVIESNALDTASHSNSTSERQSILTFSKQFELCNDKIGKIIERLNDINRGIYTIDFREVFFCSGLQGGRKYNLLAKSCSNYFNLPIIASEHRQLTETPYFVRFLVDSKVLPEAEFAGENKRYLRKIRRNSHLAMAASITLLVGGGYLLSQNLVSNLSVISQLLDINDDTLADSRINDFNADFERAVASIAPTYQAWIDGNLALDEEMLSLNVSRLEPTTKQAYQALIHQITQELMPVVEYGYQLRLSNTQSEQAKSLPLLKAYLMLNDPSKRDTRFLRKQTESTLMRLSTQTDSVNKAMNYLDALFRTEFPAIPISMDIVRATRRTLLAGSNVDLVYNRLLDQADEVDLGTLSIQRAVGFDFSNIFQDDVETEILDINRVFTSMGFSTFYRPRLDLMSEHVIADNWVLGLSNHVVPTKEEQEVFKDTVRKRYTDDYISMWRNALSELKVKRYDNIGELSNAIDLISGPSSPMTAVLNQVYNNTRFSPQGGVAAIIPGGNNPLVAGAIEAATSTAEETIQPDYLLMQRVEHAFQHLNQLQISETANSPTPWEEIITALSRLRTYIKDIADSPNAQMAALEATKARMTSAEADPIIRLRQIAQKSPEPVRSWLLGIVNQSWSVMMAESAKGIQDQWYSEVYARFRDIGLNRYPFNLSASDEISLEDFEHFFAQGGVLDSFVEQNLAQFYDTNLWVPKRVDGEVMPLSPELLVQLRNYNVIRDTLINKSTNRFYIPFSAKVLDLDSSAIRANVQVADSSINYYHGPSRIQELQWPPQSGDFSVNITIQDVTDEGKQHVLSHSGQWAVHRLFGASTLTNNHNGSFVSDVKVSGRDISLKITPLTQRNPFTLAELYGFTLPENII
ncbi:type VI secretion system membrane subunit TssM [Vibrio mexicanus]|uniref:type VI secretion system membrane subunit TssM n=1 Tax=Vibrio mexicanus TaxID=1004326 RepID=UPI00063CF027|nr:type VI secretion system membrane subunit TssM [Vibrio mexicanus]